MPLMHSKTPKAFKKNIEIEMEHGKPKKQAVAIAYSERRAAEHHKADGGCIGPECKGCSSSECYADGGDVFQDRETKDAADPEKHQAGIHESSRFGTKGVSMAGEDQRAGLDTKSAHKQVLSEMKAMKKPKLYAQGGSVADGDTLGTKIGYPGSPAPTPTPKMMDEGGMADDGDDELHNMLGEELMGAFDRKDKKAIMSAIEACVMRCVNKGDE